MADYLATFGVGHPNGKGYVKVTADTYEAAYTAMSLQYFRKWCSLYPWSEAEAMIAEYGYYLIAEIDVPNKIRTEYSEFQPVWRTLFTIEDMSKEDRGRMGL